MAVVLKQKGGGGPAKRPIAMAPKTALSLPTALSEPKKSILDYSWLVYGEKKIGKTSLCAEFPGAFFLMCEPGGKSLRVFQRAVATWSDLVGYIDLLEKGGHGFKTVVVDTVDKAYEKCWDHMCKKLCITHPHDENDFGKSWGQIEGEFTKQMTRILNLAGMGAVFLSHAVEKEVKTLTGETFDRIQPTMANQANKFMTGVIDVWAYYGYEGSERVLVMAGNDYIGAGSRLQENFLQDDGSHVGKIPMGSNPKEGYANIVAAFENRLVGTVPAGVHPKGVVKKMVLKKKA